MKFKTQKIIFFAIAAILVSFLFTCRPFGAGDNDVSSDRITYTDYEYSRDGRSLTIYLDGSTPVRHSRALTMANTKLGHDLFEVAFMYYNGSQYAIARAVWETGHAAGVSGVVRDVDYGKAFFETGDTAAAIVFVGKKSDKTLLAVGSLTHVDGVAGTIIGANSRTVTFSVTPLTAGTNSNSTSSSFITDAGNRSSIDDYNNINSAPTVTLVKNVMISGKPFPLFNLYESNSVPAGGYVHGRYKFEVFSNNFEALYRKGILQKSGIELVYPPATPAGTGTPRAPRYPVGDNNWETSETSILQPLPVDTSTIVVARNITPSDTPFQNLVEFRFGPIVPPPTATPPANSNHVFAFSFQIPVYPLTNVDGRSSGELWYLRPGYDSYLYDLDDGLGGTGGSILIGTGLFEESINNSLILSKLPDKTKYNGVVPAVNPWEFNIDGIKLLLRTGSGTIPVTNDLYYVVTTRADASPSSTEILIDPGDPNILSILEDCQVDGRVRVKIEYYGLPVTQDPISPQPPFNGTTTGSTRNTAYNGGLPLTGEFSIYYFIIPSMPGFSFDSDPANFFAITNDEDWRRVLNNNMNTSTGGVYVFVFFKSFDIGQILNVRAGFRHFIVVLSGEPDIVIGQSVNSVFADNDQSNVYYLGVWPFDEVLTAGGKAVTSQPFYINAGGSYTDCLDANGNIITPPAPVPPGGRYFISGANVAPVSNIYTSGITWFNPGRMNQP